MKKLIEQALLELKDELDIRPDYHLVDEPNSRYLFLTDCVGTKLMMIMVTDSEFWLYGAHPSANGLPAAGYTLDRRLGIDCPSLIDEIHQVIKLAIERHCNVQTGSQMAAKQHTGASHVPILPV